MSGVNEFDECFKVGATVEARLNDEGFEDSWYTATVIPSKKIKTRSKRLADKIHLKFHTLEDETEMKPLMEEVDIEDVRPVPPRETTRSFELADKVNVFQNDGWWEGIVVDVIKENGGGDGEGGRAKYKVYFRCSNDYIVYEESELRLHRDWVNGKWVPPLEDPNNDNQAHTASPTP